ncbi:MAG: hypothetical protein QM775_13815 [Pirellulales bacterium]
MATLVAGLTLLAAGFAWMRHWPLDAFFIVGGLIVVVASGCLPFYLTRRWIAFSARRGHSYLPAVVASQTCLPAAIACTIMAYSIVVSAYDYMLTMHAPDLLPTILVIVGEFLCGWVVAAAFVSTCTALVVDRCFRRSHSENWRAFVAGGVSATLFAAATFSYFLHSNYWTEWVAWTVCATFVVGPVGCISADRAMALRSRAFGRLRSPRRLPERLELGDLNPTDIRLNDTAAS